MTTTRLERKQLSTIIRKLLANDTRWLNQQEILWGDKGQYWILNYAPGGRNSYNRLCRGLVISKPQNKFWGWARPLSLIKSFPFIRFYNHGETYTNAKGEQQKASLDFANSTMIEKLDGSMVGVFFPAYEPVWHTRRMISTCLTDMEVTVKSFHGTGEETRLLQLIGEYVKQLHFNTFLDKDMTYVFEFIHEATRVLTQYDSSWNGLWLLGARNVRTHREIIDQHQLNIIADRMGCRRPQIFDTRHNEMDEILAIMEQREQDVHDFEGVVFLDPQGQRVKLKREQYVALHHLLGEISYKHLIPRILNNEEEEIASYFPAAISLIENFKKQYDQFIRLVVGRVIYWRNLHLDRKSLALRIFKDKEETHRFTQGRIMSLFEEQDDGKIYQNIEQELRTIALGYEKQDGSPQKLIEIIGLNTQ